MKQHKWHKEIKAWADGAEIESRAFDVMINQWSSWGYEENPKWYDHKLFEYQIKPQPKEPQYLYVFATQLNQIILRQYPTFFNNGEEIIGKIKLEVEE